jgi:hypothetical protein
MNLKVCALLAFTIIVWGTAAVAAESEASDATPWSRLVEGTKGLFRSPFKRSTPPTSAPQEAMPGKESPSGVKRATYTAPVQASSKSQPIAKSLPANVKAGPSPARSKGEPPRTLTEYMAQERP